MPGKGRMKGKRTEKKKKRLKEKKRWYTLTSRSALLSLSVNLMQSSLHCIHECSASWRRRLSSSISLVSRVLSWTEEHEQSGQRSVIVYEYIKHVFLLSFIFYLLSFPLRLLSSCFDWVQFLWSSWQSHLCLFKFFLHSLISLVKTKNLRLTIRVNYSKYSLHFSRVSCATQA